MGIRFTTFAGGGNCGGDLDQQGRPVKDGAHYVAERNPPGPRGEALEELTVAGPYDGEREADAVADRLQYCHDAAEEAGYTFELHPKAANTYRFSSRHDDGGRVTIYGTPSIMAAHGFARGVRDMIRRR